jgi:anti-sigma factor RsiW
MTTNDNTVPDDKLLVHALVDGELDPASALSLERRIAADPALAAEQARAQALRQALREKVTPKPLPAHVRLRVERAVGLSRPRGRPSWAALAASVAVALMVGTGSSYLAIAPTRGDRMAEAVADGHLRALMATQPFDVASSDRHTVKPWFNGKIPQAPRVVDLAREDFPLVGGRIDVIDGEAVPTLVYRHRQHLISVSAVPDAKAAPPLVQRRSVRGYNLVGWRDGNTAYWAVSDLGIAELETFVQAFRSTPAE